jgi:nucleolar protein TMA23
MNARALLKSQGWQEGHGFQGADESRGLTKPLLLARKDDNLGVGTIHSTVDQWWLNAFDQQLKGLDTSKKGKVVQTLKTGPIDTVRANSKHKHGRLYASFVRGATLEGTITPEEPVAQEREGSEVTPPQSPRAETTEERRARREAKRQRKAERAVRKAQRAQGMLQRECHGTGRMVSDSKADSGVKRRKRKGLDAER